MPEISKNCRVCKIDLTSENKFKNYARCKTCHSNMEKQRHDIYRADHKEETAEYGKKYKSEHKDKVKEHAKTYRVKHAEALCEYQRVRRAKNKNKLIV